MTLPLSQDEHHELIALKTIVLDLCQYRTTHNGEPVATIDPIVDGKLFNRYRYLQQRYWDWSKAKMA